MKKITSIFLALTLAMGLLLGVGAAPTAHLPEQPDPEPWTILSSELDPARVATSQGAVVYADAEPTAPTLSTDDQADFPIRAMVSFTDDDCRSQTYDILYRQIIEPLGIPYTLSLPLDKLGRDGYIDESQLWEMLDGGVSIACHTMNETAMTEHTVWELNEMLGLWQETAALLDCGEVLSYAYCNGIWDDALMPAVRSHFRMGFTVEGGINQIPYESYYMKRVGLFSNKSQAVTITPRDGTYLNANGTLMKSTPGQRQTSQQIPVREGEEYQVTCSAVWRGCCYVICSKEGKILEKYNVPDTAQGQLLIDHKLRIPAGAAYMVLSHNIQNYGGTTMAAQRLPDGTSLTAAKAYVDQVAREGGWLVFMTHAWYTGFNADELAELITYIQDKDIPIVDVNDAIRLTGNVVESGVFRKPTDYATGPYFVVGADGRVYTNSLELSDVPENYENVRLSLTSGRLLFNNRVATVAEPAYVVSAPVDISGCEAVLVSGWAYCYDPSTSKGYQIYTITDANGIILKQHSAAIPYADGGEGLDHQYIELPENAAYITIAGNIYHTRPELTKIYSTD